MGNQPLQRIRGTKDVLPREQVWWHFLYKTLHRIAGDYGFAEITTPAFEYDWIFAKAIGEETDIVAKEMYYLKQSDDKLPVALRPEGTAGVVRAYYENGLYLEPAPLRLYYLGPMFRHEKPQKGRLRQFNQFGIETIGEADPSEDALSILVGSQILNSLRISPERYDIVVNSVGCPSCQPKFIKKLTSYLNSLPQKKLCEDCQRRTSTNPMRVFDCKNNRCQKALSQAPTSLDYLCPNCSHHFKNLLEYLEEAKINFTINGRLVRGLDYYTRTVFEFISKNKSTAGQAIIAGGRYDNLIEQYGRKDEPAVGFGLGIERLIIFCQDNKTKPEPLKPTQVFVIQLGEKAKKKALFIIKQLTAIGISTNSAMAKDSLKSQLRSADKSGAQYAILIGQRELLDKTVILKDLRGGGQEVVDMDQYLPIIAEKINTETKK